ncbi:hypothetical protein BC834DRAFT_850105 [Gloeopeniophorella convolvens]|nr:hypothetical protein BC834DRAFT_850105 [Gloeopeniophorella convolvens]
MWLPVLTHACPRAWAAVTALPSELALAHGCSLPVCFATCTSTTGSHYQTGFRLSDLREQSTIRHNPPRSRSVATHGSGGDEGTEHQEEKRGI